MRQATILSFFIITSCLSFGRLIPAKNKRLRSENHSINVPNTQEMLSEIMGVLGLSPNFELKEANVQNIEASISHRKRYILYNPDYISWISNATNDKWAATALLAHEIGHHLNGHTIRKGGSRPALELEADEFAGFVLYKLGASLEQAQEVMKYIATLKASKTHPGRTSRMLAIQNGWNRASNNEIVISRVKN